MLEIDDREASHAERSVRVHASAAAIRTAVGERRAHSSDHLPRLAARESSKRDARDAAHAHRSVARPRPGQQARVCYGIAPQRMADSQNRHPSGQHTSSLAEKSASGRSDPGARAKGPPSEPRPRGSRPGVEAGPGDESTLRPARAQLVALLVLGFVLVAVPLYLWRRPRVLPDPEAAPLGPIATASAEPQKDAGPPDATSQGPSLGEVVVVECHDPGTAKTPPEKCDRLPEVEKALSRAVAGAATCVPRTAGGGTIVYLADVSYARKKQPVSLATPANGRTVKRTLAGACARAVSESLSAVALDEQHLHQRYKLRLVATYP